MKVWIPIASLLGFTDAQTCGAPMPVTTQQCGGAVAGQCGPPPNLVQTYQPPPRIEYQQQPPQTTYQQQPPQTTYRTEYKYVPGKPIAPPPIVPPKQPPMFNLLVKVQYEPFVKIFEHEVPYIHFDTFEKREDCSTVTDKPIPIPARVGNVVRVEEVTEVKKALRVVQHFPEPSEVKVPMFLGTVDETSQTAHHRVWYDLPVDVLRIPPVMEIALPPLQKTAGHYEKIVRKFTVQPPPVPVTVQPPPIAVTIQQPAVQLVSQVSEEVVQQEATCGSNVGNVQYQEWVVEGGGVAETRDDVSSGGFSIERRLAKHGGAKCEQPGSLCVTVAWNNNDDHANDIDLWVTPPSGEKIYFSHKKSKCGGELDVDKMQGEKEAPVENIVWKSNAPKGEYKIELDNYSTNHAEPVPCEVMIVQDGRPPQTMFVTVPGAAKSVVHVTNVTMW